MPKALSHDKLFEAALTLVAMRLWESLTLPEIAARAKTPLSSIEKHFPDTTALAVGIVEWFDQKLEEQLPSFSSETPLSDQLFDLLMTRFDLMQPYHAGLCALAQSARRTPPLALALYRKQRDSMAAMLRRTTLKTSTPLQIHALLILYHLTFCRWEIDSTEDRASTMAALDHYVKQFLRFSVFAA